MKVNELRRQTTNPSSIGPNCVGVFANADSFIVTLVSGATPTGIGQKITGSIPQSAVQTGVNRNNGTNLGLTSGVYFGVNNGAAQQQTGLGTPLGFAPFFTAAGVHVAIPYYGLGTSVD